MSSPRELIRLAREADEQAESTYDPEDLDRAVAAWESAVIATGDGVVDVPERADVLSHAAGAVLRRYQATRVRREELAMAQRWLEEAIAVTPQDAPDRLMYFSNAGVIYQERYTAGEGQPMLDRAVDSFESAVRLAAPDDPDLAQYLNNLGNALVDRWTAGADGEDLHRAVAAATRAVDLLPHRSPDRALYLNNLGNALLHRYEYGSAVEDLDAAVRSLSAAARGGRMLRRSGDPDDRAMALANLGIALRLRADHRGDPRDLQRAWLASRRAVGHTRPGSPDLPSRQAGLADVMRERYLSDGRVGWLDRPISVYKVVLGQVTTAGYCNNFATCLLTRYLAQGNRPDLDSAVELARQAVALAEAGPAETTAMCLASLGGGLRWRYLASGDEADIREALAVLRRAVALSRGVTLACGQRLNNLANALHDRFGRTGELADLNEAIEVYREAVGTVPADSAAVVQIRGNLGTALADRYQLRYVVEDLDEAIANFQAAGARGWRAQRAVHLDNLATALRERYHVCGDPRDLEQALAAHRLALRLTARASPERPPRLSNYGVSLMGAAGGSRRRVDRAIRVLRRAARADPSPGTNMARYAGNVANALRQRYEITGHAGDRDAAIGLYRRACTEGLDAATGVAFYAARDWAGWAATRRAWTEAVAASESGLRAMERLLRVQIARRDQEAWLREAQTVPALAGYAYAGAGDREGAVTAIERGRAVLWAGAVPDLGRLGRPDLVERYRTAVARLAPVRHTSGPVPL